MINQQIVNLNDIENLYDSNTGAVEKADINGVTVYKFHNQDFRLLTSYTNDGIHYDLKYISGINSNCYGYNKLIANGAVRLSSYEDDTIVKFNKDRKAYDKMIPDFILAKDINDSILQTAKSNNLAVISLEGTEYEGY